MSHSVNVSSVSETLPFQAIYQDYCKPLNRYLQGLGAESESAEELVQDTMMTVWLKSDQYQANKSAHKTWVYRIARNAYIDQCRHRQVRQRYLQQLMNEQEERVAEDDSNSVEVKRCLRKLPSSEACAVFAHYYLDKSHTEIATEFAIPLGSVKSRIRLAKQRLHQMLQSQSEGLLD